MTLFRQLFAVIATLILIVTGYMFWLSMDSTRDWLDDQLRSQTSNTVDSLGLSLQPALLRHDMALTETLINATFDHGYYRQLVLSDMQGKALFRRVNSDPVKDVPEWFIHLLPIDAPEVTATLTSGWMQFGKLSIQAHPGRAYVNLWTSFKQLLVFAVMTLAATLVIALLLVRGMLRPLDAIEAQALAITRREFVINEIKPWTREFRHVVEAMNRMTEKVRDIIRGLTEQADELQRQARVDGLTGLPNRAGFMPALSAMLGSYESGSHGLFVLIKLEDFAAFNDRVGYQVADRLLQSIAGVLSERVEAHDHALAGRIGGVDFALALPDMENTAMGSTCEALLRQLHALQGSDRQACRIQFGATPYSADDELPNLLGRADAALTRARMQGKGYLIETDNRMERGLLNWQDLVDEVLRENRISLLGQPVESPDNKTLYREVLARVDDGLGGVIPSATFMPMAERLDRIAEVDRRIISLSLTWLNANPSEQLGVNISSNSMKRAATSDWLTGIVGGHKAGARLLLEITEYAAMLDADITAAFIDKAHALGVRVVMERFGSGLASFHSLRHLKLDFIKLDGSYVRGLSEDADNRFFLRTLMEIAHGLDIRVIAEQVENEADLAALVDMQVDALQGYYIDKPAPLRS